MISSLKIYIKLLIPSRLLELIFEIRRKFSFNSFSQKKIRVLAKYCNLISIGSKKSHTFFGYYDISPFNDTSNEIIYQQVKRKKPKETTIILHDIVANKLSKISTSNAWNWQQASRLRWLPNSTDEIIFNDFRDGQYISRIINVRNRKEKIIDYPFYDIDNKGKYAITLNFDRLGVLRPGYGYTNRKYKVREDLEAEGVSKININNNQKELLFTYKKIAEVIGEVSCNLNNNYINHLSFSPSGDKFLFFWITIINDYHKASLLVYNLKTKEITPLETKDKVSHYAWFDDDCILCTTYNSENECRYFKYWLNGKKEIINPKSLITDGHPSIISKELIITDTYPDNNGFQKILFSNIVKDKTEVIAEVYSRYKINQEERTDLHPRLNRSKNQVCFDANINGYRKLFLLKYEPNCNNYNSL